MREREAANRTREAGNRDGVEGAVTTTLNLSRNGASLLAKDFGVGFIGWLDHDAMVMCLSHPANPPDDKGASDQADNEVK